MDIKDQFLSILLGTKVYKGLVSNDTWDSLIKRKKSLVDKEFYIEQNQGNFNKDEIKSIQDIYSSRVSESKNPEDIDLDDIVAHVLEIRFHQEQQAELAKHAQLQAWESSGCIPETLTFRIASSRDSTKNNEMDQWLEKGVLEWVAEVGDRKLMELLGNWHAIEYPRSFVVACEHGQTNVLSFLLPHLTEHSISRGYSAAVTRNQVEVLRIIDIEYGISWLNHLSSSPDSKGYCYALEFIQLAILSKVHNVFCHLIQQTQDLIGMTRKSWERVIQIGLDAQAVDMLVYLLKRKSFRYLWPYLQSYRHSDKKQYHLLVSEIVFDLHMT